MTPVSARRLLLFDIDGTLISSFGRGGKAMLRALHTEFGHRFEATLHDFAGSTDRQIVHTLIDKHRVVVDDMEATVDRVMGHYERYLAESIHAPEHVEVKPGIPALLDAVGNGRYGKGLLTGNIAAGARIKLTPANLYHHFPFGAFGSDAVDRNLLPPIAVRRAERHHGERFDPERVWVIGDTPRDIECGRVNGYRTLAVATGGYSPENLAEHEPDALFHDLSDLDAVLETLEG